MKTKQILQIIILITLLNSCGIIKVNSGSKYDKSKIQEVEFCELENYNGELVKTKLIYSGVHEYWSASGFEECNLNNKVELNLNEYYDGWRWLLIQRKILKLNKKYDKKKAEMIVIGKFEIATLDTIPTKDSIIILKEGFGHLGTNEAQITVKSIKIKLKNKN